MTLTIAVAKLNLSHASPAHCAQRQRDERACSVMEDVLLLDSARIRRFFALHGLMLREWGKVTHRPTPHSESADPIPPEIPWLPRPPIARARNFRLQIPFVIQQRRPI